MKKINKKQLGKIINLNLTKGMYLTLILLGVILIVSINLASVSAASYSYSQVQNYQPTIYTTYSQSQISQYWPIISQSNVQQCVGRQDFVVQIAPGGCTPAVVRSDLLEEQNVPVFCQLSAVKLNPLIDVQAIDRINPSISGKYPQEISGIGYYPAQAALRSYNGQLLGSPLVNNIGYLVVVLKQQPVEKNMPDYIQTDFSAYLQYDVGNSWGVGKADYSLPVLSEQEWLSNYKEYSFWRGKGYLRADWIENNRAEISVYTDSGSKIATRILEKGKTSDEIYIPGFYCLASLQLKLEDLQSPAVSAKIQVNDDILDVRQGTRFYDNRCSVNSISTSGGGTGSVTITCGQKYTLGLDLSDVKFSVSEGGNAEDRTIAIKEKLVSGKDNYYLVYADNLPSSIETDENSDRRFVVIFKSSDTQSIFSTRYDSIKKQIYDYAKKFSSQNEKTIEKFISGMPKVSSGELIVLLAGNQLVINEKTFKLVSFDFYNRDYSDAASGTNGRKLEEYYSEAKKTYKDIAEKFPAEKLDTGENSGEKALFSAAELAGKIEKTSDARELYNEIIKNYPDSKIASEAEKILEGFSAYKIENAEKTFSIGNEIVNIRLISIKEPSKDDASAVILYTGDSDGNRVERESKEIAENEYIYRNGTNYIKIAKLNSDNIVIDYSCTDANKRRVTQKPTIYEPGSDKTSIISFCDFSIELEKVNLKQEARVIVVPSTKNAQSEVNFTFKIGIEKRAIKLSTEKTKEMIENLNKTIESWESINNKLGKAVEGLKGACFATSTILNIKNLFENFGGKATARSAVMRGDGGWMQACENAVSSGTLKFGDNIIKQKAYSSVEACLLDNNAEIESSVNYYAEKIDAENKRIKGVEQQAGITQGFLEQTVNSGKFRELELANLKDYSSSAIEVGPAGKKIKVGDIVSKIKSDTPISTSDMENIRLYTGIVQDNNAPADVKARAESQLYLTLDRIKTGMDIADPGGLNEKTGLNFDVYADKNSANALYRGNKLSEEQSNKFDLPAGTPVQGFSYNSQSYLATLKKIDSTHYQPDVFYKIIDDGSGIVAVSDEKELKDLERKFSSFTQLDASSYKNPFKVKPQVKYWETGNYKGMPAFVPVDVQNGWYAATKQTLPSFGNIKPEDASGRITSFWLCNIGTNGIPEFDIGINDDICQMINLQTGQPLDVFPGLSREQASQLVQKASRILQEAASKYKAGIKSVSLTSGTFSVGEPATGTLGTQCQDFMSPVDCQILFNVCDPVICPSSRCNLGGDFPVDDVVQTGIIGSIALCLPNIKEGIMIPVCLTGIHAGIESYLSILKAHRDCLQESLTSGQHVGICDEVYSIYLCEFFWRQIGPFLNVLIPKMIELAYGQGTRGGGEYLTVMDSWNNMEKSVDYFTGYYANNAVKAFQIRSTEDIGTEICKSYVSVQSPNSLKLLLEPESPTQFYARFDEIPYTSVTVPATSQYKVFYHIYAGNDIGAYYSVYLRNSEGSSYYQTSPMIIVQTGFVARGEYADETRDFTAPAGYKEVCVRINDKEECGFKQVTTDFALNYISEKYVSEQAKESINSEKSCISGTSSLYPLVSPNIQGGAEEAAMASIYNRGIIRICSTDNPGRTTEPSRWKDVGYCDDTKIRCWLDENSVAEVIKNKGILNETLSDIDKMNIQNVFGASYAERINETISLINNYYKKESEFRETFAAGKDISSMDSAIQKFVSGDGTIENPGIDNAISRAVLNPQKVRLMLLRAGIYDFATRQIYERFFRDKTAISLGSDICGEGLGICRDNNCLVDEEEFYSDCSNNRKCCVKKEAATETSAETTASTTLSWEDSLKSEFFESDLIKGETIEIFNADTRETIEIFNADAGETIVTMIYASANNWESSKTLTGFDYKSDYVNGIIAISKEIYRNLEESNVLIGVKVNAGSSGSDQPAPNTYNSAEDMARGILNSLKNDKETSASTTLSWEEQIKQDWSDFMLKPNVLINVKNNIGATKLQFKYNNRWIPNTPPFDKLGYVAGVIEIVKRTNFAGGYFEVNGERVNNLGNSDQEMAEQVLDILKQSVLV